MIKKLLIPMMIGAIIIALWEQSKADKNIYIMIISIIVFMYGMMRLSAKTPSKNDDNETEKRNKNV